MRSHYSCPQHSGSVFSRSQAGAGMAQKRGGGVGTHRPCLQATTGQKILLSMQLLKWSWFRGRCLVVHASVSSESYHLRSWPSRWSWARPAAPAGKSTVQEGLDPASRNCALRVGNPTRPRGCCLPLVHNVRTPPLWNLPQGAPGQVGTRRLVAMVSVRKQGRWPRMSGQLQRFRTRTLGVGPRQGWEAIAKVCSNIRFRHNPSRRSSQSSLPKSSRLSYGGPSRDVTSQDAILHSGIHFAPCSLEPLLARSILAQGPASAILQCRRQPSRGKSTLRNGAAVRGDCLCGPPTEHPAGPNGILSLRLLRSCPTLARRCPHGGQGNNLRTPTLTNAASTAALRNGTDGATAKSQIPQETNNLPLHFPAVVSPRCPMHPTVPIVDSFTVQLPSNPGGLFLPLRIMSLITFGCTNLTERCVLEKDSSVDPISLAKWHR